MPRSSIWLLAATALCVAQGHAAELQIDADYPGGNIRVEQIAGDAVHLRPDLRDTDIWWFYWNFRVRGAAGRTLLFRFADRNPIGVHGPAVSSDGGRSWSWLGAAAVDDRPTNAAFRYRFGDEAAEARFAFTIPYQESHLQQFLAPYVIRERLALEELCKTPKGRTVELVRITPSTGDAAARVLLTARHHACETMASYVLEGLLAAVLEDDAHGRWLRERIEFIVVPMVDKDGVEDGDQGKNRAPHDHWLDYAGTSRYAAVAALREYVARRPAPPLRLAMDMHCSYLREASDEPGSSERVFFMSSMVPAVAAETARFQRALAAGRTGPIPYDPRHDLPFGMRWNTAEIAGRSFIGWASQLPDIWAATVLEVPYANANGVAVTPESARTLGRDLAHALERYFAEKLAKPP